MAGIYQRQSPLQWQAFASVRVPFNGRHLPTSESPSMAGIYQRQSPLQWQTFTNVRVPFNVSYLWLHSHCRLHMKTFEVCNILGGIVLHASYCVVRFGKHCNNSCYSYSRLCIYSVVYLFVCCVTVIPSSALVYLLSTCRMFPHIISIVISYVPFSSPPALWSKLFAVRDN
jgi:hypothetical protein